MNELVLAHSINNAILDLCKQAGFTKVRRILLKIGGMKNVNPELMNSIFSIIAKGQPTEGANLLIMTIPVTLNCYDCKRRGYREDTEFKCPSCGSRNVKLLTGLEFSVESLEVEKNLE